MQPVGSTFVQLCVDDSLNRLVEGCRLVLEGPVGADATADLNTLHPITNARNIDEMFGAGSVLAESLKISLDCCRSAGLEVYALPRENYGTAAVYEMTLAAPVGGVTSRGRIDLYTIEGRYMVSVPVYEGQSAFDIAEALEDAWPADSFFTAVAAGDDEEATLTLTAKNGGSYGNDVVILPNWHGREDALPAGLAIGVEQTVVGAGAGTKYGDYESLVGSCCSCCWAVLTDDPLWQDGAYEYLESTWDCTKPMCMTIGFTYNSGTVGQILAADTNARYMSRMAHCNPDDSPQTGDPIAPWLKVASYATISCCDTMANPEMSIEGRDFGLLRCLQQPGTCFECFSYSDKQELIEGGFVTTDPVVGGEGQLTRPYINNDITNNRYDDEGRENLTYRDMVSLRLIKRTAFELTEEMRQYQGLALFTRNTAVRAGTRGTSPKIILGKLRAWAKANIGVLFSEFENLDEQLQVLTEEETMPACYGDPRRLLVQLVYTPPLRVRDVRINIAPKFRQGCDA